MRCLAALVALSLLAPGAVLAREAKRPPLRPQPADQAMRPCPEFGPGFARAPGSATCVRIGGRVRVDGVVRDRRSAIEDGFGMSGRALLSIDARTPTPAGVVRIYVRPEGRF
jgi:hypothetical protein